MTAKQKELAQIVLDELDVYNYWAITDTDLDYFPEYLHEDHQLVRAVEAVEATYAKNILPLPGSLYWLRMQKINDLGMFSEDESKILKEVQNSILGFANWLQVYYRLSSVTKKETRTPRRKYQKREDAVRLLKMVLENRKLNKQPPTLREIADEMKWKESKTSKLMKEVYLGGWGDYLRFFAKDISHSAYDLRTRQYVSVYEQKGEDE